MAGIASSRADGYPLSLPTAARLGPFPDEEDFYQSASRGGNARESTELARLRRNYSRASTHAATSPIIIAKPTTFFGCFIYSVRQFWKHQISITVPHNSCRDHLALERTFLGYLRTSLVLSMIGTLVSQLFRLQHAPFPDPQLGFYVVGKPISIICHGAALIVVGLGSFKTWRSQNAIVRGKALAGGFEIFLVGAGVFVVLTMFFVLVIAVDIKKEYF